MRSRRSKQCRDEVMQAINKVGIDVVRINEITKSVSINELLSQVKRRKPKLLIVTGGDGTISDVVDHLVGTKIEIGLIPIGTTNNFARSLNIPMDITGAVSIISNQFAEPVDLGKVKNEYFTNVAGIGLSALVASNVTNDLKLRWGRFAYALVAAKELIKHKPFRASIEDKDSELKIHLKTHLLIVANGRYHAGKEIAKNAKLDNNQLIIFALGSGSRLSLIWHMARFYLGNRQKAEYSSYLVGNNIKISTNTRQPIELDGEVRYSTPSNFEVAPSAVYVRYKKST